MIGRDLTSGTFSTSKDILCKRTEEDIKFMDVLIIRCHEITKRS